MNASKREWIRLVFGGVLSAAVGGRAWALNPQPEVPSKPVNALNPKALNPQPEVPSKPKKTAHKKKPRPPLSERK